MDWSTYKFRCSSLPTIMTNGRSKTEVLSETAKAYLRELYIKEIYGREKFTQTKYTEKGLYVEQDSLDVASKRLNIGFIAKNKDRFENDWICGTPDAISPRLLDIKSSWDIWTYMAVDLDSATKSYFWQLYGYMWLTELDRSLLVYVLTNTPAHIVEGELYRMHFKMDEDETESYRKNYIFDDIPIEQRIKTFEFEFDESKKEELQTKLQAAREFLSTVKL